MPEESAFDLVSRAEQINHLKKLLATHHKNRQHYQAIKTQYGFDYPLDVLNGLRYEEEQIEKLQIELDQLTK